MDLGVSEPIDLSAGDHQHLIRKAADDNVQSKSKRSSNTSPSLGQQQTHGEPHSKASEQEDIFVVQISDETSPNDSGTLANPFSEASVRRGENKEIIFLGEKSKCSFKMFPLSRLSERLNLLLVFPSHALP